MNLEFIKKDKVDKEMTVEDLELRIDDYRFYGRLSLLFGVIFIIAGVLLPVLTIQITRYVFDIFPPKISFPYLIHGIALVCIGIVFIVARVILLREYKIGKSSG